MFDVMIIMPVVSICALVSAVVGLIFWRGTKSGRIVVTVFMGLAILAFFLIYDSPRLTRHFIHTGLINYDQWLGLNRTISSFLFLPVFILLALGFIVVVLPKHPDSRSFMAFGFIGAVIAFLAIGTSAPSWFGSAAFNDRIAVRSNTHKIRTALQKYGSDKGFYPDTIDPLVTDSYLANFPINPFTAYPAKNVPYGSPDCYGNFTYLPVALRGKVMGFYLIGYGYKGTKGSDLTGSGIEDHVEVVLDNSLPQLSISMQQEIGEEFQGVDLWPSGEPFPDIKSVIESASAQK
jgi:hypothetical protein